MFSLSSDFKPSGQQPQAIKKLKEGLADGLLCQTLLGVTGSGKTFTVANVIAEVQRPAIIMAPIAANIASQLGAPVEPFLMAVAVGASCAFLSPIGHQCNTLVMAPGGYKFGDYWRLGLPLEIVIAAISVPMIMYVWF